MDLIDWGHMAAKTTRRWSIPPGRRLAFAAHLIRTFIRAAQWMPRRMQYPCHGLPLGPRANVLRYPRAEAQTGQKPKNLSGRARAAPAGSHRKLFGQIIVRHMCATGEPSNPSPSAGCRKFRPTTSSNSSKSTTTPGSNE